VVLTLTFAWLPLLAYLIAPAQTTRTLKSFDAWLKRHGKTVMVSAIAIVGLALIAQGISGLA
jgi:Sap, sulfolipid-1-addressing protein